MKAILSVFDKTGLAEFAGALRGAGFDLVSTGGTSAAISAAGLPVTQVSELTGFPEILDGRVKTLHPKVHGGILARRGLDSHADQLAEHGIEAIDLVAVNLYPFVETVMRPGAALEDALENIDIGGPTLIRAAAKNFPSVIVVVDPADYAWLAERIRGHAPVTIDERRSLAQKAFQHVALYDTSVSHYLLDGDPRPASSRLEALPDTFTLGYERTGALRYGENPHQAGAIYSDPMSTGGIARAEQLSGPEVSFNNALDGEAAWRVVSDFQEPAAVVVKHNNPCGLALDDDQPAAYRKAYEGDTMSAYGGIVAFNRTLTAATAKAMRGVLYHVVIAPDFETEAMEILKKRKQARVLRAQPARGPAERLDVRKVSGGVLAQSEDAIEEDPASWEVKSRRAPTDGEIADLAFAWKAAKHVKSNAIVLARDNALAGMGAGQPNRVTSVHLALRIAGERSRGAVLASDAYFPFADGVELAAEGGVTAIAEPGGSIRDDDVIAAADRLGLALVFTGVRHFRH